MTTKDKTVPFIKANKLIKKEQRFATDHSGDYRDLPNACLHEANGLVKELLIRKANKLIEKNDYTGFLLKARATLGILDFQPSDKYVELVLKLARRLEREFLRKEEKEEENKVYLICSNYGEVHKVFRNKENAEKLLLKVYGYEPLSPPFMGESAKQFEQRHNEWIRNHPLSDGHSAPESRTVFSIKEFELIDFKPLEEEVK